MSRYTGPKRRLSRREGVALFAKDTKAIERKGATPPGIRSVRIRRRISEYGLQLREKQKAKRIFGLNEKQFGNYFKEATKVKGTTGLMMLRFLETRLDNVVYRLGFTSSRTEARQIISHGHIMVDGQKVNIPSYRVKEGQTIALLPKLGDNIQVKKAMEGSVTLPAWLQRKALVGKVLRMPEAEEMEKVDERLIVEYYSR